MSCVLDNRPVKSFMVHVIIVLLGDFGVACYCKGINFFLIILTHSKEFNLEVFRIFVEHHDFTGRLLVDGLR